MVTTRGVELFSKMKSKGKVSSFDTIAVKQRTKKHSKSPSKSAALPKVIVQGQRQQLDKAPTMGDHVLFIFVGAERQLVTLHTDLLPRATQEYITTVSNGLPTFQLPAESPDTFRVYRAWLYSKQLYTIESDDQLVRKEGGVTIESDGEWTKLGQCYILGKHIQDERFCNVVIDALIEKMTSIGTYPTGIAGEVYGGTEQGDNFRKLIVDIHVWRGIGQWIRAPHDDANGPAEFLRDVVSGMAEAGGDMFDEEYKMPWEEDLCGLYHSHTWSPKCSE